MKLGLHRNISNADYHKQLPPDEHFYSSSQLKTIIEDVETFKKKYITGELEANQSIPAFDIGTYFHTAILEPHLLDQECAVFTGARRAGKEWKEFQEKHAGKAIITKKEYEQAKNLIVATQQSEIAMDLHRGGVAEVSLGVEVWVVDGEVYIENLAHNWKLDIKEGWVKVPKFIMSQSGGIKIRLKVRCDYIHAKKGYIADLKSTTGNAKDVGKTRNKISSYSYDLSAAMYVDLFNARFLTEEKPHKINTFWWVFASKDFSNCQSYFTGVGPQGEVDDSNLRVGRAKWRKAVLQIAKYQQLDWEIPEEAVALSAQPWEMEWVKEGDSDKTPKHSNNKIKVKQSSAPIEVDLL